MDYRTKNSKVLAKLRKEPQTNVDLPRGGPLRDMIRKIDILANSASGSVESRGVGLGGLTAIYYLVGDERRAVRKFIKENSKYVTSCFSEEHNNNANNPLKTKMNDFMFALLAEEYEIMEYNGEI